MVRTFDIECSGYSVKADWYEGESQGGILLNLIGWTSNRKKHEDLLSAVVTATGMGALTFDYSGHGDSPFSIDSTRPAQHFLEVIYVFDWLKQQYPDAHFSVMGSSYGGFMATQLTKYRDFEKLILRVPAIYRPQDFYTLSRKVHGEATDRYRKDPAALSRHPLLARASNFKGKTMVVVHELDELVPIETTDAYISAFKPEVYIAKGFKHSFDESIPREKILEYQKVIADWLKDS